MDVPTHMQEATDENGETGLQRKAREEAEEKERVEEEMEKLADEVRITATLTDENKKCIQNVFIYDVQVCDAAVGRPVHSTRTYSMHLYTTTLKCENVYI